MEKITSNIRCLKELTLEEQHFIFGGGVFKDFGEASHRAWCSIKEGTVNAIEFIGENSSGKTVSVGVGAPV